MENEQSIKRYIIRDVHGNILKENGFSVVGDVHVTVEPGYGEPSADVEYVGGELYLTLHNIEGNGITEIVTYSQAGDEAINTITIKTNDNPEGVVLEVKNGSRGNGIASSSEVMSPYDGGTNTFTFTDDNGNKHVLHTKNGSKGEKGKQGDSVLVGQGDLPLAHVLGQENTKAMSQKGVSDAISVGESNVIDLDNYSESNAWIANTGKWLINYGNPPYRAVFIPVTGGQKYRIIGNGNEGSQSVYAFLTSNIPGSNNQDVSTFAADSSKEEMETGETSIVIAPYNAKYLWVGVYTNHDLALQELAEYNESLATDDIKALSQKEMSVDTSNEIAGYPSKVIGEKVGFTSSESTISLCKVTPITKGVEYVVKVEYGNELLSSGVRDSVIVDENNIVKQSFRMIPVAGGVSAATFTATSNGYLVLSVDGNYISVNVTGSQTRADIYSNIQDIAKLKDSYVFQESVTVEKDSTYQSMPRLFRANHTYVFVIETTDTYNISKIGITGVGEQKIMAFEGLSVVKFAIDEDVNGSVYITNADTGYSKDYTFVCEEWNERDIWRMQQPNTVTVAAWNSDAKSKYASDFICDWDNDEVELQAAINSLPTKGGRVLLHDGHYRIQELRDTENEEVGLIGLEITRPSEYHYVEISGVSKPIRLSGATINPSADHEIKLGATIWLATASVANIDNNTHVTLIGAMPLDNIYERQPRALNVTIRNIGINIPNNTKSIKCIDGEYWSAMEIENVAIGISAGNGMTTNPNSECIGIRGLPGWNYGIYYTMRCVKVYGLGTAFDIGGEHIIMEQCAARYCRTPYRFLKYGNVSAMAHPHTLINCCEEHCITGIIFGANPKCQAVNLYDYNIEYRIPLEDGVWGRGTKAVEEVPGQMRGNINFSAVRQDYTTDDDVTFWEEGCGHGVKTKNDSHPLSGPTSARPVCAEYLQQYFDTDLNKFVTYNGSSWV